jgi:predicted HTH transcriptional regulator
MREQMLAHGLEQPLIGADTAYFQVTFPGPGENIERLRVPRQPLLVTPVVESSLNERQKSILAHVLEAGSVTRRWCVTEFGVASDTAGRDLKALTKLGLLVPEGRGRAARYVLPAGREGSGGHSS